MARTIDDETLAAAYSKALDLEKAGAIDAAIAAYAQVLALDPEDHGGVAVRMASLGRGTVPERAPDAYVAALFDQHADDFEDILVAHLNYGVPGMIRRRLAKLGEGPFGHLLDLGCGTGLVGAQLRDMCAEITGIDLSENMVSAAYDKAVYDSLYVAEVADYLNSNDEAPFDLIVAADVLPYLGNLDPLFTGVTRCLEPSGVFVFSSELLPGAGSYSVGPNQRFLHAEPYLTDRLATAGLSVVEMTEINVRLQDGEASPGHLVVARLGEGPNPRA